MELFIPIDNEKICIEYHNKYKEEKRDGENNKGNRRTRRKEKSNDN